ncbi:sugar phosphate isomerase/epimerase family protein [Halobacillus amylolyticus]|uniref:Sugar phosphate isomerase/epimerase n=1 Tax=Halobacillus amylolyticus TaxID=2932259 RepID=A0ABY4HFV4_9BACI|nr:sugar phosphate isomerase/epimerase [Halobacillus amylolyticus]UOR13764.1 sugar phosphate isomerase/epimerase [Halobacillus amylolyticus]
MKNIPIAAQMYTLRNEVKQDFASTLKKVADLGFSGVELAGYEGLSAGDLRKLLDQLGLKAASSHIPLDELTHHLPQVIEDQKTLGSKYVVCPYFEPKREEDYDDLVTNLKKAGEICSQEGLTLCYHNHDFELEKLSDGRTALQTIFEETDAEHVQTEFDVYWLKKAGEDPIKWLERYKGRTPLLHLKDMTTDDEQFFAELGTGGIDIESILEKGKDTGVHWWIVEQDESRKTPLESLEISLEYLKARLPYLQK